MRNIIFLASLLALLLPEVRVLGDDVPVKNPDIANVAAADNAFALDLYAHLRDGNGNIVFSPLSLESALAMTWSGAAGDTAKQMASVLHLAELGAPSKVGDSFAALLSSLNGDEQKRNYRLEIANALWGQRKFTFNPDFLNDLKTHYAAALTPVDFAQSEAARGQINDWVAKQTQDRIKDLIPAGMLDASTRLVLTNAVYFKAKWVKPFTKESTRDDDFFAAADKPVKVATLHGEATHYNLFQDDRLQVVELPYVGDQISMVIILPRAKDGLAVVEKSLSVDQLTKWTSQWTPQSVLLSMPKFKSTQALDLASALGAMGMPLAFSDHADFSRMSTQDQLLISAVVHKALIIVDEQGTEAAAASAVMMSLMAMPVEQAPVVFKADHPFLYFLRDTHSGAILFIGRLVNPAS